MIVSLRSAIGGVALAASLAVPVGASAATPATGLEVAKLQVVTERGSAAKASRPAASAASVHVDGCVTGSIPASRAYLLSAAANAVSGARSVRVRFRLFYRLPGKTESEVKIATGNRLGSWEDPVALGSGGVGHLKFVKRVYRLSSPATYRASVDFEWYSGSAATGRRVKNQTINAASCVQPDLRPDLRISSATVSPVGAGLASVTIVVVNDGKGRSASGTVRLFVPGPGTGTGAFDLALGRIDEQGTRRRATRSDPLVTKRTLKLEVARCAVGSSMTIEIDPAGLVGEQSTANNFSQLGCLAAD